MIHRLFPFKQNNEITFAILFEIVAYNSFHMMFLYSVSIIFNMHIG